MPGYLLHEGATVQCAHLSGLATPQVSNPRVKVGGSNTILFITPYDVKGCLANAQCTLGTWIAGASRVRSLGQPLVLTNSVSTCVSSGLALKPTFSQQRVSAV